jgi:peptide/nickel transport system substrate-binding protein
MEKYLRFKGLVFMTVACVLVFGTMMLAATDAGAANDRLIRKIVVLTRPQAAVPDEFETCNLLVAEMQALGINAQLKVMPWEQMADFVWYQRDKWDMTGWQMAARPERLDPDEFTFNLFHSSTAPKGYNFVGYISSAYDKVAEEQRITIDRDKRQKLIKKAQEIIAEDVGYLFSVNQTLNYVFNNKVFAANSVKDMAGLGIKNFWTYINIQPTGSQKDFICNSNDAIQASNPFFISGSVDSWITELIWDRIMRMGEDGLPKPWAAEKVEWQNPTTVKIVMRAGMKWHDGKPVTVEDVKFSFEAPLTGEVPMYKPFVTNIKNIEIVDNRTLVFTLHKPSAAFETATLAKLNLAPKHIWQPIIEKLKTSPDNAEAHQEKVPIGSGPFKFGHWKFQEEFVLMANKDHFAAPKIDRWIVRIIPNMEAVLGMILNGEINFTTQYVGDAQLLSQKVKADPKLTMISSVDLGFKFVAINHRRPPFSDKAFRRALAAVMDRQMIVDAIWKGFAVPGDSIISPALKFWKNTNLNYPTGGNEAAKKMLKAAGYEWDKKGRLMYPQGQKETAKSPF